MRSPFHPEPPYTHGQPERTAVLLCNLGTPDEATAPALRRYLGQFLSDHRVVEIPKLVWMLILHGIILRVRPAKSAAKYASVWTPEGSPLAVWTAKQATLLRGWLGEAGHNVLVRHAMRYGNPSIASQLDALKADLQTAVMAKANKLRAVVDALGEKPTEAMAYRGQEIETMIKNGDWTSADAALDSLIKDSGVNEPEEASAAPDFSTFEPGDTNLDALQSRFESVKERAQDIVSIPVMRRMLKAKEAFETAKAAQDATAVGRILTFAEKELEKK